MLVFLRSIIAILILVMQLYEDNKEIYGVIIDNIKKNRKHLGLTQQGLALRAHISKGYLSQIEAKNYQRFCSLDVLISIARALEIPLYQLFLPENVVFIDEEIALHLDRDKIKRAYEEICRQEEKQEF